MPVRPEADVPVSQTAATFCERVRGGTSEDFRWIQAAEVFTPFRVALPGDAGAMTTVIFACVHNAGRSQMAAAFFNAVAAPKRARAVSAGTQPGERVHPEVVEAMREVGIDLSSARPQKLTDAL